MRADPFVYLNKCIFKSTKILIAASFLLTAYGCSKAESKRPLTQEDLIEVAADSSGLSLDEVDSFFIDDADKDSILVRIRHKNDRYTFHIDSDGIVLDQTYEKVEEPAEPVKTEPADHPKAESNSSEENKAQNDDLENSLVDIALVNNGLTRDQVTDINFQDHPESHTATIRYLANDTLIESVVDTRDRVVISSVVVSN